MHAHVVALRGRLPGELAFPSSAPDCPLTHPVVWTTWLHVVTMFVVRTPRVYSVCREPCVSDSSACLFFFRACNCVKSYVSPPPALSPQAELQFFVRERERVGAVVLNTRQRHKDKHRSHVLSFSLTSVKCHSQTDHRAFSSCENEGLHSRAGPHAHTTMHVTRSLDTVSHAEIATPVECRGSSPHRAARIGTCPLDLLAPVCADRDHP